MEIYGCTLFEGNYHFGVAALLNSLYRSGFRGIFYAGYRGPVPPWAEALPRCACGNSYLIGEGLYLRLLPVDTPMHLGNFKPRFMQALLRRDIPQDAALCYFDADITVRARWSFFEQWVQHGIALVEDCTYPYLPGDHPLRLAWLRVAESIGLRQRRRLDRYYNSGFIGLPATASDALTIWERILQASESMGYDRRRFTSDDRTDPWQAADQDHLNAMLMTTDVPLTTVGPDGMDFAPGGYLLSHAVYAPKPWGRNYIRRALDGQPPGLADKEFWKNAEGPIRLFPQSRIQTKRREMLLAQIIGRLWRR